jgi:hypothetical protein
MAVTCVHAGGTAAVGGDRAKGKCTQTGVSSSTPREKAEGVE